MGRKYTSDDTWLRIIKIIRGYTCNKVKVRLTPFEHFVGLSLCRLLPSENHVFLYSRLKNKKLARFSLEVDPELLLFGFRFPLPSSPVPSRFGRANVTCHSLGLPCDPVLWVAPRAAGGSTNTHNKQRSASPQSVTHLGTAPIGEIRRRSLRNEGTGSIPSVRNADNSGACRGERRRTAVRCNVPQISQLLFKKKKTGGNANGRGVCKSVLEASRCWAPAAPSRKKTHRYLG